MPLPYPKQLVGGLIQMGRSPGPRQFVLLNTRLNPPLDTEGGLSQAQDHHIPLGSQLRHPDAL